MINNGNYHLNVGHTEDGTDRSVLVNIRTELLAEGARGTYPVNCASSAGVYHNRIHRINYNHFKYRIFIGRSSPSHSDDYVP